MRTYASSSRGSEPKKQIVAEVAAEGGSCAGCSSKSESKECELRLIFSREILLAFLVSVTFMSADGVRCLRLKSSTYIRVKETSKMEYFCEK